MSTALLLRELPGRTQGAGRMDEVALTDSRHIGGCIGSVQIV